MRSFLCVMCVLVLALFSGQGVCAQYSPMDIGEDTDVIDMRWLDQTTLVLLQRDDTGVQVSLLDDTDDSLQDLPVPRSLQRAHGAHGLFRYALAPLGNALAVIERNESVTSASRLSVYRIDRNEVTAVSTYRMPMEFWPDACCWDEAGENLFLAARPYLQPQQEVSLAVFRLADAEFLPLLDRSELDLVRQMAFIPASGELAVLCGSHEGMFPAEEMLVMVNPKGNRTRVVHARAGQGELQLLDDGSLLLRDEMREEVWIRQPASDTLYQLEGSGLPAWDCQTSRDSKWLAGLQGSSSGPELLIQSADGERAFTTGEASGLFRFNFDGSRIALLNAAGSMLQVLVTLSTE